MKPERQEKDEAVHRDAGRTDAGGTGYFRIRRGVKPSPGVDSLEEAAAEAALKREAGGISTG